MEQGTCHICGRHCSLSFEHVPPQRAFNNASILLATGEQLFQGRDFKDMRMTKRRKGNGAYTLCQPCNNHTGSWYGDAYISWAKQAAGLLTKFTKPPTLYLPFEIYPLRVVKQIAAMFFSVNSPEFRKTVPYLEQFVLDKRRTGMHPDFKILAGYNMSAIRNAGLSGILDGNEQLAISEISFFPFTFVLTMASRSPDPRLFDITDFSKYHFDDSRTLHLKLPLLDLVTGYPGDYRSRAQVESEMQAAMELMKGPRPAT